MVKKAEAKAKEKEENSERVSRNPGFLQ